MVSVFCAVYNHEKYIRRCLEGFVMQKTDFPFEVLIHDDASTDRSAEIIREFEQKYPDVIKPIYQTENQYSRGVRLQRVWNLPRARGKYIALCEGDDCWTSPYKLQTQFNYMERFPDCALCAHQAVRYSVDTKKMRLQSPENAERDYSLEEVIRLGGSLFATNALFYRKEDYAAMPDCFFQQGVGDVQLMIYLTICGRCHYLPQTMSQYNANVRDSWTQRVARDPEKLVEYRRAHIAMLQRVDDYYGRRYHDALQEKILRYEYSNARDLGDAEALQRPEFAQLRARPATAEAPSLRRRLKGAAPWLSAVRDRVTTLRARAALFRGKHFPGPYYR